MHNSLAARAHYREATARTGMLIVAGNDSSLHIDVAGRPAVSLHGGEVLWLARGETATITGALEHGDSSYLVLFFKDGIRTGSWN